MTWDCGRQLIEFDGNTFAYDARGRRISKNDITFKYDIDGRLIKQSNGLEFIYDHTGVCAIKHYDKTYFYRKNAQGDVIALLDNTGAVVVKYIYNAWGWCNTIYVAEGASEIANLNPFRYRSYYFDTETNLYFLKTRYYDAIVGRFINVDDISYLAPDTINGLNLYAYCGNNPVMRADPNGTEWWNPFTWDWSSILDVAITVIGGLLGAAVGGLAGIPLLGAAIGVGVINNAVNAIYYNSLPNISTNEIKAYEETFEDKSYYVDNGYINRWERLKFIKSRNPNSSFNSTVWHEYSEYSIHMYGWFTSGWAMNIDDSFIVNKFFKAMASSSKHTHFSENRWYIEAAILFWGTLGF